MCEANAYLLKDGKEELFLEALDTVEPDEGRLRLTSISGEQKFVRGSTTPQDVLFLLVELRGLEPLTS
ncbi:MAG: CooT family nickel-binding protein [Deltaproteobacteria bacterium]|nr:CooT family nickel-binding protein [Deltaproteobacteria bacterium]MBW1796290.1 CooT family nickel-binding protein [Deltaproteobacteria bacterium]